MKTLLLAILLMNLGTAHAIINGIQLSDGQFPQIGTLEGNIHICTVTLVGDNAIVTAAHCARAGVNLTVVINGLPYNVRFESHENVNLKYQPDIPNSFAVRNDIALGVLDRSVPNVAPVTVSFADPSLKEKIMIGGSGVPYMGIRQIGYMSVVGVNEIGLTLFGDLPTPQTGAKCDSGGGNFRIDSKGELSIVAVNSSGNWGRDNTSQFGSFFGRPFILGSSRLQKDFLKQAAKKLGANICGVTKTCRGLRVRSLK